MRPILGVTLQLARRLLSAPVPDGFVRSLELSRPAKFHLALLDPVHRVLTSASDDLETAPRYLAIWLAADATARRRTIRDIATARFDWFVPGVEKPEPPHGGWLRGTGGLAKLSTFWFWLYLRRSGRVLLRSTARHPRFWEDP